ncbi:hypothetical protein HCA78_05815 [Listeria booriae]|uniref:Uncharacterized protein n=2 Tax=Listeria booriae TaxID=1552123 RepID=A0A842CR70_9LIST|nr:hypothetical protein [Listeria booriae]MBC1574525.1 hypothetical protein [Listeria booriae]MBC2003279.1 hypothetical protein [Listeria booriae]MBC2055574.1 hypothetical protein [Listeria booriae]MBC2370346.1 hypothetical protein [Listeria booriae]
MNNEIVSLYGNFNKDGLALFTNKLICFINKHEQIFSKFVFKGTLNAIRKFDAADFYLGTSEDNLEVVISHYSRQMKNATEERICYNVVHLIWDIAAFMTQEVCPSCQDENLKIASSIDKTKIYKTCDNCLITLLGNIFIDRPTEMIPANKEQVDKVVQ